MKTVKLIIGLILSSTIVANSVYATDKEQIITNTIDILTEQYPDSDKERISKGVSSLASYWFSKYDGTEMDFTKFCTSNYIPDSEINANLKRVDDRIMVFENSLYEYSFVYNENRNYTYIESLGCDKALNDLNLNADYGESFTKFIRLNFPYYTYEEKMKNQFLWSREKWAMVRIGDKYSRDIESKDNIYSEEFFKFNSYMSNYFIDMDRIIDGDNSFLFEEGLELHSHRGLRDNIKGLYSEPDGTDMQRIQYTIAEHIIRGTIPEHFRNDSTLIWNPVNNKLFHMRDGKLVNIPEFPLENNERYTGIMTAFRYRTYNDNGQMRYVDETMQRNNISLEDAERYLREYLSLPVLSKIAEKIEKDLNRPLEPFDIWYSGFQEQTEYSSTFLDSVTRSTFPTPEVFKDSIPYILKNLGFPEDEATYIGKHIEVRPVVSGGYSNQPASRDGFALLTTVFDDRGMDYKSYRVAMHELGHCVCGIYSTRNIDYFSLAGVPNSGITEAMAELFAYLNIKGLGFKDAVVTESERKDKLVLAASWYLYEMAGQALTEIETWKWFINNPNATEVDFKKNILKISSDIWNQYFSRNFNNIRNCNILSIYNHFTTGDLYLFNYFLSNIIMLSIDDASDEDLVSNLKAMCSEGSTSFERWMMNGLGETINIEELGRKIETTGISRM